MDRIFYVGQFEQSRVGKTSCNIPPSLRILIMEKPHLEGIFCNSFKTWMKSCGMLIMGKTCILCQGEDEDNHVQHRHHTNYMQHLIVITSTCLSKLIGMSILERYFQSMKNRKSLSNRLLKIIFLHEFGGLINDTSHTSYVQYEIVIITTLVFKLVSCQSQKYIFKVLKNEVNFFNRFQYEVTFITIQVLKNEANLLQLILIGRSCHF